MATKIYTCRNWLSKEGKGEFILIQVNITMDAIRNNKYSTTITRKQINPGTRISVTQSNIMRQKQKEESPLRIH